MVHLFYLIVFGSIFAGGVHDYLTMISFRHGAHLPALASQVLGKSFSHVVNFFTSLVSLVGTVLFLHPLK
jgi:carbon starvation protein CstA